MGEPLDQIFFRLAKANMITYPPIPQKDDNTPKSDWYKEHEYCDYHRVKGHTTLKCMRLKHYIQDLIDHKEIQVDASAQASPNAGLQIYQNVFSQHDTGKNQANANQPQNRGKGKQEDHTAAYINYDKFVGCIAQVEPTVNVIHVRGPDRQCATTTRSGRITVAGAPPRSAAPPRPTSTASTTQSNTRPASNARATQHNAPSAQYNIIEHLGNMPAQISILDLLRTSPIHQEILDKALKEGHVPIDINTTQFETLVGHLSAACALSFKESDIPDVAPDHTLPLRIAVMVRDFAIKRVLVDNGSALNLCTLKFIKKIRFTEADIQHEVITIKAYDNLERTSEGTITLPIQLGPATQDTVCHVVDLDLPFNILLG